MGDDQAGPDNDSEVSPQGPLDELWNLAISENVDNTVPTKSSNEILTELFGAFNAEPPKSPVPSDCDSETEGREKKHRKKRKKEKRHKKKVKSKRRLSGELETSSVGLSSESENDNEKKKERKHKRRRKSRHKSSEVESEDDGLQKNPKFDSPALDTKLVSNGNDKGDDDAVVSSTSLPCASPPLPPVKTNNNEDSAVFETITPSDKPADKCESKGKLVPGKIVIKDLKFSSVYEATVKEVEEQAKAKAEKYEEGELSDSSSSQKTSDSSDEPCNGPPPTESDIGEPVEPTHSSEEQKQLSKRSHSKEKDSDCHKKSRHRSRSHDRERKSRERDKHSKRRDKDKDKHKDVGKDAEKSKDKDKEKDKGKEKEKDRNKDRHKDRDKGSDRDRDRRDRDRKRGRSRSRSPHRRRSSSRSRRRRSRERRRSRTRSNSRTRSRSRDRRRSSGSDHIDKKKLLEIARRNAMNMLQAGILPSTVTGKPTAPNPAIPVSKPDKNAAKTVDELTEYCKELSKRENLGELSSLSGSDDSDTEKPFHHPFQVKDRPSFISLNIKNAVQLPLKTLQERTVEQSQLRIQFPVSSGQQHRKTESEWVPVTPQKKAEVTEKKPNTLKAIEAPKVEESKSNTSGEIVDIGTLVSQRLSAMRKMHDDEQSSYAMSHYMHGWNNSLPGQFTGDTGARLLTPQQLASGAQAWARKDQLQTATPVRSGMGMTLLQKMGWRPGEGLGKNKEGCQEPLQLEVKMDRKGLVAAEEIRARRPPPMVVQPAKVVKPIVTTLEGKHPVSLLTEYCSKRHFGPPVFDLCMESGPDHKKDFLFKVRVNGLEYLPDHASPNKKQARAEAASVCLKALGVLLR